MTGQSMADADDFNGIDWHHAESLALFLTRAPVLSLADRLAIVTEAARLLESHYAHLPQKRADQGVDPPARLRALHRMLEAQGEENQGEADGQGDLGFHAELCGVFAEWRDLHTLYILPKAFAGLVAFLPFQLGIVMEDGTERVIVTHVLDGFGHELFRPGVEILRWSGMPIGRAIARVALLSGGANPAAARARALAAMTQRPLLRMAPPDEAWVELDYRKKPDALAESLRIDWKICPQQEEPAHQQVHADPAVAVTLSLDAEGDALRRHRKAAYVPHVLRAERQGHAPAPGVPRDGHPFVSEIETQIGDLRAWQGEIDGKPFGLLRIRSFKVEEEPFLDEIQRLLSLLPQDRLVIDVRDNPGGLVAAAERMLQYLTGRTVAPVRLQFLATPANLALCQAQSPGSPDMKLDLSPWIASLQVALDAKQPWSEAFPMTPPEACADTGRIYPGKVALITSARSYSAADIFIAGFRDHAIGPILGVDANTGAGGANMWTSQQLDMLLGGANPDLPGGVELRLAIRRVQRVSDGAGRILEEAGIIPDAVHLSTRRDLLGNDPDLIAHAVQLLGS